MKIGQSAGKSYAYLIGTYLGDGCVTLNQGYKVFRLNTIDEDFALATKQALSEYTDYSISIHLVSKEKDNGKPQYMLRCGDPKLAQSFQDECDGKNKIPEWILNGDKETKIAFIAGVMDSEGFVAANKSNPTNRRYYMGFKSCDVWVPDFIKMLQSIGIKIGKVQIEKPRKEGYKPPTRFTIKMQSWIDAGCYFNIKRKQDRVDLWNSAGAYVNRKLNPRRLTSETTRQAA